MTAYQQMMAEILDVAADVNTRLDRLAAANLQYHEQVMAEMNIAVGCSGVLENDGFANCTCDLTGRHFLHHCPECDITWIKA